MRLIREIKFLLWKDLLVEMRQKYAIGGILLYVVSTIFLIYIALNAQGLLSRLNFSIWNILFWMTLLFASVNAIAKSFFQESKERQLYYYSLVSPQAVILSKMIYNTALMLILSLLSYLVFVILIGNPVIHHLLFITAIVLGGTAFSFLFSTMSAIASKADNNSTLMAILSFPIILPVIMILLRLVNHAFLPQFDSAEAVNSIIILAALNLLLTGLSFILFPYLWRD